MTATVLPVSTLKAGDTFPAMALPFYNGMTPASFSGGAVVQAQIRSKFGDLVYSWDTTQGAVAGFTSGGVTASGNTITLAAIPASVTAPFPPGVCTFELAVTDGGVTTTLMDGSANPITILPDYAHS